MRHPCLNACILLPRKNCVNVKKEKMKEISENAMKNIDRKISVFYSTCIQNKKSVAEEEYIRRIHSQRAGDGGNPV